jgi:hypothetical protein
MVSDLGPEGIHRKQKEQQTATPYCVVPPMNRGKFVSHPEAAGQADREGCSRQVYPPLANCTSPVLVLNKTLQYSVGALEFVVPHGGDHLLQPLNDLGFCRTNYLTNGVLYPLIDALLHENFVKSADSFVAPPI